ncbi:MAG TPA: thiamine phosphate synthase [Acidobacteriaceae bacterium]|nr:thiamine phosphate synthase [Acidobacteriaceae bacterium]
MDRFFLRCAITDLLGSNDGPSGRAARQAQLQSDLLRWTSDGVNLIQLREKNLEPSEVFHLARSAMNLLRDPGVPKPNGKRTRFLLNTRADLAAAAGADGVHLTSRSGELLPDQVRAVFRSAGFEQCFVSMSCHSLPDVEFSCKGGADLILFGPVFEKRVGGRVVVPGVGPSALRAAVERAGTTPLLALGGISTPDVEACLQAGAAGVAGIRLFAGPGLTPGSTERS